MMFRLLLLSLLLMVSAIMVPAQQTKKPAKITMKQARSVATAKAPGKIKNSELEKEHGKVVYSFDIATPAGIREIQVDAYSGSIVSDQIETAADEAKEAAQEKKKSGSTKNGQEATSSNTPK